MAKPPMPNQRDPLGHPKEKPDQEIPEPHPEEKEPGETEVSDTPDEEEKER